MLVKRRRRFSPENPPGKRQFMAHQEKAFAKISRKDHPALFMHMRLGKTLTIIRWVVAKSYVRHVVVVAPLTVLEAWENELSLEGESYVTAYGLCKAERQRRVELVASTKKGRRWLLINYDALRTLPGIAEAPWDVVILDESTKIKNPTAQITKLCTQGFRDVRHRAILTGLPKTESDLDLFCQFQFLHGQFASCNSFWKYRAKYFEVDMHSGNWRLKYEYHQPIKELVHEKAFVLTRQDAGIGERKIYEVRRIEMTPLQKKLYQQVETEFAIRLESGEELETQWMVQAQTWLAKLAGGFEPDLLEKNEEGKIIRRTKGGLVSQKKTDELLELLEGELNDAKVVIWYRFVDELEHDHRRLTEAGVSAVTISGSVVQEQRKTRLQQFRGTHVQALLATEKVAKFGIDCSAADVAIYRGNEWSCEDRVQSEDRIVHPQKKRPLLIIDLVTRGTIDEDVVYAVKEKALSAQNFMHNFGNLFKDRMKSARLLGRRH